VKSEKWKALNSPTIHFPLSTFNFQLSNSLADSSFQDKTEQPTGHKLEKAREQGNVPKSADLNSAAALLAGTLALMAFGRDIISQIEHAFRGVFAAAPGLELTPDMMPVLLQVALVYSFKLLGPFLLVVLIATVLSNIVQSGWVVAPKALDLNPSKLSPMAGLKRIFSSRGMVELLKGIVKLIIVGWVGYLTVKGEIPTLIPLMDEDIGQVIGAIGAAMLKLALRLTIAFAILGAIDFLYQKWKYTSDQKMTKQEVKEEHRQMEGDPLIKGKIRQLQFKISMNRMIKAVPKADVVLANPVHLAVALKYDPETMSAPKVVAKGKRKIAEKIKQIARDNGVPVIEEPELARALYKAAEVDSEIPYELFQAVAEVLAMVYRLKQAA